MDSLVKIITAKLFDHVMETEEVGKEIEKVQKEFNLIKKDNWKEATRLASELMILKDKMLFHKACAAALQDVLDEAEKCKN